VTSERERQTLDLLLTTAITPWQILWGKLLAGLRVSSVLTGFLLWPILLASVMVSSYWTNLPAIAGYLGIVLLSCITTAMLALFTSVIFRKTSVSLMTAYLLILLLFCAPLAARFFAERFFPAHEATKYRQPGRDDQPFCGGVRDALGCRGHCRRRQVGQRRPGAYRLVDGLRHLHRHPEPQPAGEHDVAVPQTLARLAVLRLAVKRFGCGRAQRCRIRASDPGVVG
jgi:hypothetical protein